MPYVKQEHTPNQELIEKYKEFHFSHQYDAKIKQWRFMGYTCTKCGRTVQNPNIVPKHSMNCKKGPPTVYCQDPDPSQIRDIKGRPWQPYDSNQKKSVNES